MFKRTAGLLLGVLLILAAVAPLASAKTTLTFMTPLDGADGAYMDDLIARFNKEHPDIEVVHLVVANSLEYKMKVGTGIATKSAPEVLFMRKGDTPDYLKQFRSFTAQELLAYGIDVND